MPDDFEQPVSLLAADLWKQTWCGREMADCEKVGITAEPWARVRLTSNLILRNQSLQFNAARPATYNEAHQS